MRFNCSFWQGRRVFLPGYTGFKGSWLSLWLYKFGADVTGYAPGPPAQPSRRRGSELQVPMAIFRESFECFFGNFNLQTGF
jgi:hypothetical protein